MNTEDDFYFIYSQIPKLVQQFVTLAENLIALGQSYATVTKNYSKLSTQQRVQLGQHKDSFVLVRGDIQATVDDFKKIAAMLAGALPAKD